MKGLLRERWFPSLFGTRLVSQCADGVFQASIASDRATIGARADEFLATSSWDTTWSAMVALLEDAIARHMSRAGEASLERVRIVGA